MTGFNMKQWLQENKSGVYSKTMNSEELDMQEDDNVSGTDLGVPQAAADAAMQQQDDQIGTYVDDAEMGEARAYGMDDKPDPEKYQIVRDEKSGKITQATNDDGDVFKIGDKVKMGKMSPRISSFIEEQGKVKAIITTGLVTQAIDIDGLETEVKEDVGVGYVMKVAPADPGSRRF